MVVIICIQCTFIVFLQQSTPDKLSQELTEKADRCCTVFVLCSK